MSISRVAQIAGIPYSTAWRAINRSPGVSPQAAAAVQKAMEKIGYVYQNEGRRKSGRPSARNRTRSIALLYLRESSPLSISILRIVQQSLMKEDLNLICGHVAGSDDLPPAVQAGKVDGILGYGEFPASAATAALRNIPAVWMMSPLLDLSDAWGDRVMPDNPAIGKLAAQHLLARGHRHLAFFDPVPSYYSALRCRAFLAETKAIGDVTKPSAGSVHVFQARRTTPEPTPLALVAAIKEVVKQWVNTSPRPTGIFVPTDPMAVIVYRELEAHGVKPGHDVQIISCDHQPEHLSLLNPQPASIDINRETIARLAVERLLWRMKEKAPSPPIQIAVRPELNAHPSQAGGCE